MMLLVLGFPLYALQRLPGLLDVHTVMVSHKADDLRNVCGAKDRMPRPAGPEILPKAS